MNAFKSTSTIETGFIESYFSTQRTYFLQQTEKSRENTESVIRINCQDHMSDKSDNIWHIWYTWQNLTKSDKIWQNWQIWQNLTKSDKSDISGKIWQTQKIWQYLTYLAKSDNIRQYLTNAKNLTISQNIWHIWQNLTYLAKSDISNYLVTSPNLICLLVSWCP